MKNINKMILVSVLAAGMVACNKTIIGEGPLVAQNRPATNFMGIDVFANADVYFEAGDNLNLEVIGQQNILDNLETIVEDNNLVIQGKDGKCFRANENVRINITAPGVNSFSVNGTGSIYGISRIEVEKLKFQNNGSGTISLRTINAKSMEALATSSGNIIALDGNVVKINAKISGNGKIDFSGIMARTASTHNAGSGKIYIKVADHLEAAIEQNGSTYYSGYPDISSHISGTGHLIHL